MYSQDPFANSPLKTVWIVHEVSVLVQGDLAPRPKLIPTQQGTAHGVTRRFFLRKETRAPKIPQSNDKAEIYTRFRMIFGGHDDTAKQPHENKRLSVLDECEEEVESGRRDTMFGEDWDNTFLQSVISTQALEQLFESSGPKIPTRRNSWKDRFSSSNLRSKTPVGQTENLDIPTSDRTIIKTVTHTAISEYETPALHQHGTKDFRVDNVDETATFTPLNTSLALERERMKELFDDDLHEKRLELIRENYALPDHNHVLYRLNDMGLRRMAGGFQYRMKTLNNKFTSLLMKHRKVKNCTR
ncbi:hypothetical protein EG328_005290 [Venturia inaequalis]|uniref:Uncharacterized protein n=1 Tax=Venturia inaequalis TaxID=5025 RepID=A0A8H3ULR9_VENIN|nr:hypothetical protein EG328_005290 [Venturia inaequalis]